MMELKMDGEDNIDLEPELEDTPVIDDELTHDNEFRGL